MKRKLEDTLFESPISFRNAKSILKDHFTTASKIDFLASEVESSPSLASTIPPLIFGHSALCEVLFDEKHGVDTKLAVLKLLKSCFLSIKDSDVENCMRDAHIPLLLGAYGAKLSKTDQVIYEILRLYERRAGVDFSKYYPLVWGDVGLQKYASLKTLGLALWNRPTADEVLECLDPKTMKISSLWLPLEIPCEGALDDQDYADCYDPRFLLPLFVNVLGPDSIIDLRRFAIERSCLGYTIACLSLHDSTLRGAAYTILYRLREHLRSPASSKKNFREKPQIVYILTLLRQSVTKPLARIPSISTAFLSRAVQLTAMPWDSLYSTVHGYLLLKPRLDFGDVPEFYKLFQSSSTTDRFWILKLLADGMREMTDYKICERRDVFRLMIAYHDWAAQNSATETSARNQVLKVVEAVCRIPSVAPDFCYRYSILSWLAGLVVTSKEEDIEQLAIIYRLINEYVVQNESVPEYVAGQWIASAEILKEGLEKNGKKAKLKLRRCGKRGKKSANVAIK